MVARARPHTPRDARRATTREILREMIETQTETERDEDTVDRECRESVCVLEFPVSMVHT